MAKYLGLIFLLLKLHSCYSQKNVTDSLFWQFKNDINIELNAYSGIIKFDNETKISYYELLKNTSINDLIKYTNDSNAAIRFKIFVGLIDKKTSAIILNKIVEAHKNDSAKTLLKEIYHFSENPITVYESMLWEMRRLPRIRHTPKDFQQFIDQIREFKCVRLNIDGVHHHLVTKNKLLKAESIAFFCDTIFKHVGFSIFVDDMEFKSKNNKLTPAMKKVIQKAPSGTEFYFTDFKVIGPDKKTRILFLNNTIKII
jgi:hypothetical protein